MPIVDGKYTSPTWVNGAAPALDAGEMQDITDTLEGLDTEIEEKQNTLTFDTTPTAGSANPVTSGGVKTALDEHYVTAGQKSGTTLGDRATAEGTNTTASGNYAHAEGNYTQATKANTHAEGSGTKATNADAHAEGESTTASGYASHSEGNFNTASGYSSHAEGRHTQAVGYASHAEGYITRAGLIESKGTASHAEGYNTKAYGYASHAGGEFTRANHRAQHVFGRYNEEDANSADGDEYGTYAEIVGNGNADTRSNARTLDWGGNERLSGKLTVGAGPENSMDVTTKQYVDTQLATKQDKLIVAAYVLAAASWSESAQTISVASMTANATVIITPSPASAEAYSEAGVYCTAQGSGTLTFSCGATAPSSDLTVNVLIAG